MRHTVDPDFWELFERLPKRIRTLARKNFELLKSNPRHPSLHFKPIGDHWSVRVGRDYRAVCERTGSGCLWFWIGSHKEYDELLK